MTVEESLKKLMDRQNALKGPIAIKKRDLIAKRNYAGILYIIRYMSFYERDKFLTKFLGRCPDEYLFILAFANPETELYERAEETANDAYEQDIYAIREDVEKYKDDYLCKFLAVHNSMEDYQYVYSMTEEKERHFRSYKLAEEALINHANES
ncbi:hypothetical protein J6V86_00595 [bacterium]|nr:hypothetical protein [bacterium]